jgi:predicted nucleic acid-binding protein
MQISFWDALIVEAAVSAGCQLLYMEYLQPGWKIDRLEVKNPFMA